jgi:L-malate glycosyltransferase
MTKIKVLHIVKSLGRGGAETLLLETLKHHNKNQFQFYYIYFLPWKNELVGSLKTEGAIIFNVSAKSNIAILLSVFKIKKFIKQNNIQIVHCHLPWAGISTRIALKFNKKIKLIYTEHNIQERYHWITKLLNKITYNWQHKVIAVSQSVKNSICKNIGKSIDVQVILNGVDTNRFKRNINDAIELKNELHISIDKIVIGNICVFRSQKRLKVWVDIFEEINRRNQNYIGILVGGGILYEEIKQYIKDKNLTDKIILTGLQINTVKYFNIIDIFLLTSEFEGLPIALLEAMSMGCVPITTNAGGVNEVIQQKINGLMTEVSSPNKLIDFANELIDQSKLRNSISIEARKTVEQKFSVVITTKKIEDLYISLV